MQNWRRSIAPLEPEGSMVLRDVAHPEFLAFEIEPTKEARACEHPDTLPIRNGRRCGHVRFALGPIASAQRPLPLDSSGFTIDRPQLNPLALSDIHEDVVVPDDRC